MRPIGYFVHHQGRGHAERCVAIARALPADRPMTVFCARPQVLAGLPPSVEVVPIPSLFEPDGPGHPALEAAPTPDTLHCAPLGWPGIRAAVARIAAWFEAADPALFVTDVSAELAQMARIASVPVVTVLQHGARGDPGHMAAYQGASGILAPFDARLEQPDRPDWMRARTCYAAGLGLRRTPLRASCDPAATKAALGLDPDRPLVTVLGGGGGDGLPLAPLGVGARAWPQAQWRALGGVARQWHATPPGNLEVLGWSDMAAEHLAVSDVVVSTAGNTVCHEVLASGRPWIVVPEWRYFDEQGEKAAALSRAGAACALPRWPASVGAWREAIDRARALERGLGPDLVDPAADRRAAEWLTALADRLWAAPPADVPAVAGITTAAE